MKSLAVVALGGVALIGFAASVMGAPPKAGALHVFPRDASALPEISLGDLIASAIPTDNSMAWDHLQIANVLWITEGIDYVGDPSRFGMVRVRAAGVASKMLRQRWEELSWSVELSTDGNSKWGPTLLNIRPGFDGSKFEGKYICFGEGFSGCAFDIEALNGPHIKYEKQCTIGSGGGQSVILRATTIDGRRGTVVYQGSGGSGGYSNSVAISTLAPAEYCHAHKDRGY